MFEDNHNLNVHNLGNVQAQPRFENVNLNNGGIELGPIREVQYVVPQAQLNVVEQNRQNDNRNNFKYMTKCFIAIIISFMIASSICFVVYDRNVQQNKNSIELLKTEVDNQSSNQRDHQGDPVDTLTFFVEDNKLYSSKSTDPIFDLSQLKGLTGENGITPNLYVEDDKLFSSTSSIPLIDFGKFKGENGKNGMDATCKSAGFPVIENHEYSKMKLATGVDYIGLGYDPITDTHGANFFDPSFSEMKVVTDPIDGESHKNYDYINRYDHNFKHNVIASASTYRDANMYRNSKTNGAGGSVGFSSFLSASASTSKTKAMTSLSEGNKAVVESIMMDQSYEITAEQDLTNYVKSEYIEAVDNLPEYDKNDNSIVDMYDHLSYLYKDFVVTFVGLGGMITQQSIVSNANKYYSKYSSENIEGGVSGGWGPFSGSVSASTNTYSSSLDSELKSDITTHVFVSGGNAKGDLDNPSESISNIANWGDVEWQSYYDRTEKSPTKISERVIPVWYLLKGDNQKKMRDYLEDKYGTEKQDIYSMTSYFNNELSRIEDGFKNKQDDLEKKILGISVPNKAAIKWYPRNFAICGNDLNCDDRNQRGKNWYYKDRPYPSRNSGTKLCNSDELMESFEYSHGYLITCWRPEIVLS
jgi:hypothetical protein